MKPSGTTATLCRVLTTTTVILVLVHCLQGTVQVVFDATLGILRRGTASAADNAGHAGTERALPAPEVTKWRFRADGTVDRMRRLEQSDESPYPYEILTVSDVDGSQVWKGDRWHVPFEHVELARKTFDRITAGNRMRLPRWGLAPPSTLEFPVTLGEGRNYEVWRYNRRTRCFRGHLVRGGPIGYFGRNGFSTAKGGIEPFEECISYHAFIRDKGKNGLILWATRRGIYRLDLGGREIRALAEVGTPEGYSGAQLIAWDKALQGQKPWSQKQALVIELRPSTYKIVIPEPYAEHRTELPPPECGTPMDTRFGLHHGVLYAQRHVRVDAQSDGSAPWRGRHVVELYRIDDDRTPVFVNRYGWPSDPKAVAREASLSLGNALGQRDTPKGTRVLVHESAPQTYEVFVAGPHPTEYRIEVPPSKVDGTREDIEFGAYHGELYAQRRMRIDSARDTGQVVELYHVGECSAPHLVSRDDPQETGRFANTAKRTAITSIHPLAYGVVVRSLRHGWASGDTLTQLNRLLLPPEERSLHRVYLHDQWQLLSAVARNSLPFWPPAVTTGMLIAAALLLSRRRKLRRQAAIGWCAWTLLFNVSGFLACLVLRPVRQEEPRVQEDLLPAGNTLGTIGAHR